MFTKSLVVLGVVALSFGGGLPVETPDTQPGGGALSVSSEVSSVLTGDTGVSVSQDNTPAQGGVEMVGDSGVRRGETSSSLPVLQDTEIPVSQATGTPTAESMVVDSFAEVDRLAEDNKGVLSDGVYTVSSLVDGGWDSLSFVDSFVVRIRLG